MTPRALLTELKALDNDIYYQMGRYKQYTIDFINDLCEELEEFIEGNFLGVLDFSELKGSLIYHISSVMEICDKELLDYEIFKKAYSIINKETYDNGGKNTK